MHNLWDLKAGDAVKVKTHCGGSLTGEVVLVEARPISHVYMKDENGKQWLIDSYDTILEVVTPPSINDLCTALEHIK